MVTQNKQHGNPNIAELGKATRWPKGQSGNPAGPKPAKVQFWRYVQQYAEMTDAQIEKIDVPNLTQSRQGALKYALKLARCEWQQVKELLDRDEGPIVKKVNVQREDRPPVVPFSELPEDTQKQHVKALLGRLDIVE